MPLPSEIRAIHMLRHKIYGLSDDETYRDFLFSLTSKRSSKDLTSAEARLVLAELRRLVGDKRPASPPVANPKATIVGRLLREAYNAGWDLPTEPGPCDSSLDARRARVRIRVLTWLQTHHPHIQGTPRKLEAWPLESLQACLEHIKGKAGAAKRWGHR